MDSQGEIVFLFDMLPEAVYVLTADRAPMRVPFLHVGGKIILMQRLLARRAVDQIGMAL